MLRTSVFALVSVLWCVACIGDPSHTVTYTNSANQPLTVYEAGSSQSYKTLASGQVVESAWPVSRSAEWRMRVEARDAVGQPMFCRRYSYQDMEASNWHIDLILDPTSC